MNSLSSSSRSLLLTLPTAVALIATSLVPCFAADTPPAATTSASADQEAKLVATFANATLKGRWAPLKDGQLEEEKEDTYQVVSAKKLEGERWEINARIQSHGRMVTCLLPAIVKWAGDTAVLLFDNIVDFPRRYSARLMIHDDTYSGTWSGGDHGGMLYGVITRAAK
jgi:hypothetical protein